MNRNLNVYFCDTIEPKEEEKLVKKIAKKFPHSGVQLFLFESSFSPLGKAIRRISEKDLGNGKEIVASLNPPFEGLRSILPEECIYEHKRFDMKDEEHISENMPTKGSKGVFVFFSRKKVILVGESKKDLRGYIYKRRLMGNYRHCECEWCTFNPSYKKSTKAGDRLDLDSIIKEVKAELIWIYDPSEIVYSPKVLLEGDQQIVKVRDYKDEQRIFCTEDFDNQSSLFKYLKDVIDHHHQKSAKKKVVLICISLKEEEIEATIKGLFWALNDEKVDIVFVPFYIEDYYFLHEKERKNDCGMVDVEGKKIFMKKLYIKDYSEEDTQRRYEKFVEEKEKEEKEVVQMDLIS